MPPLYQVSASYLGFKPYVREQHDQVSHAKRAALVLLQEADDLHARGELSATVEVTIERRGELWARTVVEARLTPKAEMADGRCTGRLVKGWKP